MVLINIKTVLTVISHRVRHPGHGIGESCWNRVAVDVVVIHSSFIQIFKSANLGLTSYLFITCHFPKPPNTVRIKKKDIVSLLGKVKC